MTWSRSAAVLALVMLGASLPLGSAQAQNIPAAEINGVGTNLVVQNFDPIAGTEGVFTVEGAGVAGSLLSGGLVLNFAKDPLVFALEDGEEVEPIISGQLVADAIFTLGFLDTYELGLVLPIYFINDGNLGNTDLSGATLGDVRLRPKWQALNSRVDPLGLAVVANVVLPTGDDAAFTSTGGVSVRPGVVLDTRLGPLLLAANFLVDLKTEAGSGENAVGNELYYGFGGQYAFTERFSAGLEFVGSSPFDELAEANKSPLEAIGGVKLEVFKNLQLEAGVGLGVVRGIGSPDFRVFTGLRYIERDRDTDGDGLMDSVDACPEEPEDKDKHKDKDGCPDPDNDNDGILDVDDKCPNRAEDKDGFEDEDGCLDPDNDEDGILDGDDQCMNEPEDKDGFEDENGCPDPDNDQDGILDVDDKCPDEPGVPEEQGCPVKDRDGDGIPDDKDKCPDEAEVVNGIDDEDGCPDKGKVVLTLDEIKILDRVYFDTAKATIQKKSFDLLDQVAKVLKTNPQVELIEVQGHTDDVGGMDYNMKLSQERADAVRQYLINAGVEADRLVAKGYGPTAPAIAVDGLKGRALKDARSKNRRVQFIILRQKSRKIRTN